MGTDTQAGDFAVSTVEVAGLKLSSRLTVGGILSLEQAYGVAIDKIKWERGMVIDFVRMIAALLISARPDMSPEKAEAAIKNLDLEDMHTIVAKTAGAFTMAKNPSRPTAAKRKAKKKSRKKKRA
jgi:hypothetical protein